MFLLSTLLYCSCFVAVNLVAVGNGDNGGGSDSSSEGSRLFAFFTVPFFFSFFITRKSFTVHFQFEHSGKTV